jgi:hypothetical protein
MSLINDALKQARQTPPRNLPKSLPSLQPAAGESPAGFAWLVLALAGVLIIAAICFIGWVAACHLGHGVAATPDSAAVKTAQLTKTVAPPVVAPPVVASPAVTPPVVAQASEPPAPANPPDLPKLQGIFYSPTAPSAILDGKTVRPGDPFKQYRVKAISQNAVILIGPGQKEIRIGIGD